MCVSDVTNEVLNLKLVHEQVIKSKSPSHGVAKLLPIDVLHSAPMFDFSGVYYLMEPIDPAKFSAALEEGLLFYPIVGGAYDALEPGKHLEISARPNRGICLQTWISAHEVSREELLNTKAQCFLADPSTLVTIRLNNFPNACAVGFTWTHGLGDGFCCFDFLSNISKFYQRGSGANSISLRSVERLPKVPLPFEEVQREVLALGETPPLTSTLRIHSADDMDRFVANMQTTATSGVSWFCIDFSGEQVHALKEQAMADLPEGTAYISKMDAFVGHLMKVFADARWDAQVESSVPELVSAMWPYNWRFAFPDYFDDTYIGNCFSIKSAQLPSAELASENGACRFAAAVRRAMMEVSIEDYTKEELWRKLMTEANKIVEVGNLLEVFSTSFIFTDWTKFPVFDFVPGNEKPWHYETVWKSPLPWFSVLVPKIDGGILVMLNLPSSHRELFEQRRRSGCFLPS